MYIYIYKYIYIWDVPDIRLLSGYPAYFSTSRYLAIRYPVNCKYLAGYPDIKPLSGRITG